MCVIQLVFNFRKAKKLPLVIFPYEPKQSCCIPHNNFKVFHYMYTYNLMSHILANFWVNSIFMTLNMIALNMHRINS